MFRAAKPTGSTSIYVGWKKKMKLCNARKKNEAVQFFSKIGQKRPTERRMAVFTAFFVIRTYENLVAHVFRFFRDKFFDFPLINLFSDFANKNEVV